MIRKPFQSKLIPHLDFIRECRAKEMSYPFIAAELRARFGLSAAPSTIFAFVKVRSRRRSRIALLAPDPPRPTATMQESRTQTQPVRPTSPATTTSPWLVYDPTKPLEKITTSP